MKQAASSDEVLGERICLFQYRVPEELYDYGSDPDGLVNLIGAPNLGQVTQQLKKLLHAEMKRTDDPLLEEFETRFMK